MSMHSTPTLLAIECSQRTGSVALTLAGSEPQLIEFDSGGREDDQLLPSIDALLTASGRTPDQIDAIGVSIGPGGFTGLRIAIATVKGMAEVTGCDVHAIPSAMVAAESERQELSTGDRVVVASAAKQDTSWITPLECLDDGWVELPGVGIQVVAPPSPDVLALCEGALVLADEHVPRSFHDGLAGVATAVRNPRFDARSCLRVTAEMARRKSKVDPLELAPLYPREPEAVRKWRLSH